MILHFFIITFLALKASTLEVSCTMPSSISSPDNQTSEAQNRRNAAGSIEINKSLFLSLEQVWNRQLALNLFGPRLTGSEGHEKSIDYIMNELQHFGLEVHSDTHTFKRWEEKNRGLTFSDPHQNTIRLPVLSSYPYSGKIPTEGISGKIVYSGKGPGNFKRASCKIAVVEVTALPSHR